MKQTRKVSFEFLTTAGSKDEALYLLTYFTKTKKSVHNTSHTILITLQYSIQNLIILFLF